MSGPTGWRSHRDAIAAALTDVVRAPLIVSDFGDYAKDESGAGEYRPDFVVRARTTAEVAAVMRIATQFGVPVVPRGAGSGKSGGCLAVAGGIVLSLAEMRAVREVSPENDLIVCEPGVILQDIQRLAEEHGRFYPPDPASLDWCTIGGNVAENAGGPRAYKYGVTRDYVLGLEVVLPSGEIIRTGRRSKKGVVGYDLTALLCGSEGTLGIITEVTLQVVPLPTSVETAFLTFGSVQAAIAAVDRISGRGHRPRTLELLDSVALAAMFENAPRLSASRGKGTHAGLIVELDGVGDLTQELTDLVDVAKSGDAFVAQDEGQRREIWGARRQVSTTLKRMGTHKLSEDIAVPRGHLAALVDQITAIAERHQLRHAAYGHAGDGNLHANFFWTDDAQKPAVDAALAETFAAAVALGGTISGEHGVGLLKREFVALEQSSGSISLQRRLKAVFDPAGILNPHKLFPSERNDAAASAWAK